MTALAPFTATSVLAIERFDLIRLVGGNCRPSDGSGERATHHAPRHYKSGVSAGIVPLRNSEVYRVILSGGVGAAGETLYQDADGKASPSGLGVAIGQTRSSGSVGDVIEFAYDSAAAAIPSGGQVESTYTLDRVTIDADIDTLSAGSLLATVRSEAAEYAFILRLDDYDNIWVLDGDTGRQRLYKTFSGVAKLFQTQVGIAEGPRSYDLITSDDSIHDARTAGDWFNGSPVTGDRLEVEYTPASRHQRQFYIWNGASWDRQVDNARTLFVTAPHGFDLTDKEGQRVPVAWHLASDVDTVGRAPVTIEEVNHFLVRAGNAIVGIDFMEYRTAADTQGRYYDEVSNGLGATSEDVYWDPATNSHTTAKKDLRLFQVTAHGNVQYIRMSLEDTRAMGNAAGRVPVTAEYDQTANLPAGQIVNLNANTGGLLVLRAADNSYTNHHFGDNVADFKFGYGKNFWIESNGIRLEQNDLTFLSSSTVRIDVALQAGLNSELSVHTLL